MFYVSAISTVLTRVTHLEDNKFCPVAGISDYDEKNVVYSAICLVMLPK